MRVGSGGRGCCCCFLLGRFCKLLYDLSVLGGTTVERKR